MAVALQGFGASIYTVGTLMSNTYHPLAIVSIINLLICSTSNSFSFAVFTFMFCESVLYRSYYTEKFSGDAPKHVFLYIFLLYTIILDFISVRNFHFSFFLISRAAAWHARD